ncbi:amidohydrolase [Dictyobacter formicarum]|uniref:Amidohydrolase n=1 Tax=Dictyobacter formicarum TaxID=2778368 RepID=A0ABQ3VAH9_9CHLR|nr:amidohydrolase [Dictyobacter formicarum]
MPTLEEINAAAPETPVFLLNLYASALLNKAALHAVGYTRDTPSPARGEIQKDAWGNPTGLLLAQPDAALLYATLAHGPRLGYEDQLNSTRHFLRELNRLGLTSVVDAGGGLQRYPEDYQVIEALNKADQLTLRIAYNLFTQQPGKEIEDFRRWFQLTRPGQGNEYLRMNGIGEKITDAAYDFENFQQPRPEISSDVDAAFKEAISLIVEHRWPFRLHATYDESINHYLDLFEDINRRIPFDGLRWFFDHAETISPRNIERVKALGGGIAIQDRLAFQGEYFVYRYGKQAVAAAPPFRRMLDIGVPVGAGTDATRVASYNPWVALCWLITGRTVGGMELYPPENRLSREEALLWYTSGSAWFSGEEEKKGRIAPDQLADLAVLSDDYFIIAEEDIPRISSVLTLVGGKIVYAAREFAPLDPPLPPVSPSWSPVAVYGGARTPEVKRTTSGGNHLHLPHMGAHDWRENDPGCDCFVF